MREHDDEFKVGDVIVEIGSTDEWLVYIQPSPSTYHLRPIFNGVASDVVRPAMMNLSKDIAEKNFVKVRNEWEGDDDEEG